MNPTQKKTSLELRSVKTRFRFVGTVVGLASCILLASAALAAEGRVLRFTAMGCGPYLPEDELALARYIKLENEQPASEFVVHLGDIVSGRRKDWEEAQYKKIAGLLRDANRLPTFVVPGDNEWNDMDNPAAAWKMWANNFLHFDQQWKFAAPVARQPERAENFAFVLREVLFLGLNKVGGRVHDAAEWHRRHRDNAQWISTQMEQSPAAVHSAVIMAQDGPEKPDKDLLMSFRTSAIKFARPVLWLHADGHKWFVKTNEWAPNIWHVQTDVVSTKFPPVQVTVTGEAKEPFLFNRRLNDPRWKDAQ